MPTTPQRPRALGRTPFRGADAVAAGLLTKRQLQSLAWRRLLPNVYVDSRVPDSRRLRIVATALWAPEGSVISGRSAAFLWGAELGRLDDPVEVRSPVRRRPPAGLAVHVGAIDRSEVTRRGGVTLPTPLHTAWELARTLPLREAVQWVDALAHAQRLSTVDLVAHGESHQGAFALRIAAQSLALCDPRAESPPESLLRVEMRLNGVPAPIPQWNVIMSGLFVGRLDFAWPALRFGVEYDGKWHGDAEQLARDRERLRKLTAAGWEIFHVTWRDLRDIDTVIRSIAAAIVRRSSNL